MDTRIGRTLMAITATVALAGCATASAPTWTFRPVAAAPSGPALSAAVAPSPAASSDGQIASQSSVEIHAFDLGFKPAEVSVAAPGPVAVTFVNDGATTHNITFADGTALTADPGKTTTGTVTVPAAGLSFLCSIPGHAAAGMTGSIAVMASSDMPGMSMAPASSPAADAATTPVADPSAPVHALRRDRPARHAGHGPRHLVPDHRQGHDRGRRLRRPRLDVRQARSPGRPSACISATRSTST